LQILWWEFPHLKKISARFERKYAGNCLIIGEWIIALLHPGPRRAAAKGFWGNRAFPGLILSEAATVEWIF
jgi:hypothetical protein